MRYKLFDVFSDRPFWGSSTAVVFWDGAADRPRMHEVARELCVRDTFFIMPPSDPGTLFSSLTFTPAEELAICGQGMVAGVHAVLEERNLGTGSHRIETALGPREVQVEAEGGRPLVWVGLGRPQVAPLEPAAERVLAALPGIAGPAPRACAFVDLGRRRLLVETDLESLPRCEPAPAAVLAACSALSAAGVVFFAEEGPGRFRLRHFARSLGGAEDPVTGGAAGALLALLRHGRPADPPLAAEIRQGGFRGRGGLLLARWSDRAGGPLAGGRAVKIAEGKLLF